MNTPYVEVYANTEHDDLYSVRVVDGTNEWDDFEGTEQEARDEADSIAAETGYEIRFE